jgi:hypothetical protein
MVNNCKNKRLKSLVEDEFKEMNKDIVNEINKYVLYYSKERFTYKDMREEYKEESEEELE